jgi:flavin reductase (DIM6/NTAB) family NADH-FMN oxidoreductase RutF
MDLAIRKRVLRSMTYGLYVLTACAGDEIVGGTITWLSQASFTPPLVMAGIRRDGRVHAVVESAGGFAVNIVTADHAEIASAFFRPTNVDGDRINGYAFERGAATGAPLLLDLPAWFEARLTDSVRKGDHTVFVAEIVACGLRNGEFAPLVLKDTPWSYAG